MDDTLLTLLFYAWVFHLFSAVVSFCVTLCVRTTLYQDVLISLNFNIMY